MRLVDRLKFFIGCECCDDNEKTHYFTTQTNKTIELISINKKNSIFDGIVGYSDIKKELVKALDSSSPVSILLCGPRCVKSKFLK